MGLRAKIAIGVAVVLAAILLVCWVQHRSIQKLTDERDTFRHNAEALMSDVETYKFRDSLNAARVQSMELTLREYERFRADDAKIIKELKAKNRDLAAVNKTQSQTIIELRAIPRDTVIIRDSVPIKAVAVHCGDEWYDFDGILTEREFTGRLQNRDSLLVAETVKYKRFLGFLWKTNKVKERHVDVLSRNPHTEIVGLEYVVIEK